MSKNTRDSLKIVMFLSFQFIDSQTRYQTTKRESLSVVKNLIEVRWLVQESKHSIKLYTNHQTLLKCLQSEDMIDRLVKWQLTLFEFDLDIYYVSKRKLIIANDFSRLIEYLSMNSFSTKVSLTFFVIEGSLIMTDRSSQNQEMKSKLMKDQNEEEFQNISQNWELQWQKWIDDS